MRFRLQTDYALKALLFLARRGKTNSTTEEIADFYGISAAHLGRVIRRLQRYGFVKAIRGRRGGVRLNRDPQHLTLGEIVETLEEGGSLAEPTETEKPEAREQASRMRAVLRRALGMFTNYLSKATLAEMVSDQVSQDVTSSPQTGTQAVPTPSEPVHGVQPTHDGPRAQVDAPRAPAYAVPTGVEPPQPGGTAERPPSST